MINNFALTFLSEFFRGNMVVGILEKLMRENYGDLIDKCERQEENLKRIKEELKHNQEENARLRRLLEENGLTIEG